VSVSSNAGKIGEGYKDNIMIYPSGLLMGKVYHSFDKTRVDRMTYTKHYYIGSERISAKTGTVTDMGWYPASSILSTFTGINVTPIRAASTASVADAKTGIDAICDRFGHARLTLSSMPEETITRFNHVAIKLSTFYFHPDHLGSSSYITNAAGTVSQHMEYLPFGETLVDEHTSSINSPFKFNGKEKDEETGNYYYGARYYDPKWSIFISVDPLAEKYSDMSPYTYCLNNPINAIDPDGRDAILIVFPKYKISTPIGKVGGLGHAGVLLIDNKTGLTKYYEYGRYDKDGKGIVRTVAVSNVVIGKDGKPTIESLNKVMGQISKSSGQGGEIDGAYVISDKFKDMRNYAEGKMKKIDDPKRKEV